MSNLLLLCIIIIFSTTFCDSTKKLNLNGEWIINENTHRYNNIKATVPGGIYSDLMDNGIIGDIFYGNNDVELKWVQKLNWSYHRNFSIPSGMLSRKNVNLVLDGLDTFSSIKLNGQEVGSSENMFVQYIFDVKQYLNEGINKIEVTFTSPVEVARKLHEEQNYTVPPTCPPVEYNGECHVNMIRKMQSSFAWDWGPSFPSVGIWKDVYLEAYNDSVIRYVVSDVIEKDKDYWTVNVDTYLANNVENEVKGKLKVDLETNLTNITKVVDLNEKPDENNDIIVTVSFDILKAYVNSWWPNGYGASKLYNLEVTYGNGDGEDSVKKSKIGFRKIELIQDKVKKGLTFYFKVNDVPVFMKGSNEIPIDVLPERGQNRSKIEKILKAAHDSHMNMIRVWGGGVYESDYFYELSDELGILIWQDFMFACAMYPSNDPYLKNVKAEIRHQIKRLYSHTSVALFSGNNENEGALRENWYSTAQNYTTYYNDYIKLYITNIKTEFSKITHNRGIFITSSPTNGKESDKENYVASNPASSLYGDIHFYNYLLDPFNSNFYPTPRFASEYGYQSLPSLQSWSTVTNNTTENVNINSIFMYHRQHHPLGNLELKALLLYFFHPPSESNKNFNEAFVYYTQIAQALAVKIETEHYRSCRSSLNGNGEGYTMGALFWQLNDVWVAPSWSSIDYLGRWKMLQYYSKNFFAPIIVTGSLTLDRSLKIYLVSDLPSPLINLTVSLVVYKWDSFQPVNVQNFTLDAESTSSKEIINAFYVDRYLSRLGCGTLSSAKSNCFFYFFVTKNGVKVSPDNFAFPVAIKNSNITAADIKIESIKKIGNKMFFIEITGDRIALFVWLESFKVRGTFSENGFILVETKKIVYFEAEEEISVEDLLKSVTVTHLLDRKYFTD